VADHRDGGLQRSKNFKGADTHARTDFHLSPLGRSRLAVCGGASARAAAWRSILVVAH
jgi:hypothetical protein